MTLLATVRVRVGGNAAGITGRGYATAARRGEHGGREQQTAAHGTGSDGLVADTDYTKIALNDLVAAIIYGGNDTKVGVVRELACRIETCDRERQEAEKSRIATCEALDKAEALAQTYRDALEQIVEFESGLYANAMGGASRSLAIARSALEQEN